MHVAELNTPEEGKGDVATQGGKSAGGIPKIGMNYFENSHSPWINEESIDPWSAPWDALGIPAPGFMDSGLLGITGRIIP